MPVLTLDYRHCDRKRPKFIKHVEIEGLAAQARQQLVAGGVDAIAFGTLRQIPGGHSKCSTYGHPNCSTLAMVI